MCDAWIGGGAWPWEYMDIERPMVCVLPMTSKVDPWPVVALFLKTHPPTKDRTRMKQSGVTVKFVRTAVQSGELHTAGLRWVEPQAWSYLAFWLRCDRRDGRVRAPPAHRVHVCLGCHRPATCRCNGQWADTAARAPMQHGGESCLRAPRRHQGSRSRLGTQQLRMALCFQRRPYFRG